MPVVKINALEVPEGAGADLEARLAARKHAGEARKPVASGSNLLEFEVVDL